MLSEPQITSILELINNLRNKHNSRPLKWIELTSIDLLNKLSKKIDIKYKGLYTDKEDIIKLIINTWYEEYKLMDKLNNITELIHRDYYYIYINIEQEEQKNIIELYLI